jgi:hypothetical protein
MVSSNDMAYQLIIRMGKLSICQWGTIHVLTIVMIDNAIWNATIKGINGASVHSPASSTISWALDPNSLNVLLSWQKRKRKTGLNLAQNRIFYSRLTRNGNRYVSTCRTTAAGVRSPSSGTCTAAWSDTWRHSWQGLYCSWGKESMEGINDKGRAFITPDLGEIRA